MKAFILAAGLGTRLRPYTEHTPKPLFPVGGRPLIDRLIRQLEEAGCTEIAINLHHLAGQVEHYIRRQAYRAGITLLHEPEILGTGGGIANLGSFWGDAPLLVINSDILTDIDLRAIYDRHVADGCPATLVVHDRAEFNTVTVADDQITAFADCADSKDGTQCLAFTGIQVIDREFLDFAPDQAFFSSISVYAAMISAGRTVRAHRVENHVWEDIGTPERYLQAARQILVRQAFAAAFNRTLEHDPVFTTLKGDGSDRTWSRVSAGPDSLVVVEHGIRPTAAVCEADAFINIGRHLHSRGLPVPALYAADPFSGLAFVEDLGDRHLQDAVLAAGSDDARETLYRRVIASLVALSQDGARGFDPAWAYQTAAYDRQVILEDECHYFIRAFIHLKMELLDITYATLEDEFEDLADRALSCAVTGFMHRDCQSRNIMLRGKDCYFIDFQGGRRGPLQYDLASLLIDPYVGLASGLQVRLQDYALERLQAVTDVDADTFRQGYYYCSLTRNLQILGAFGFLSVEKGKPNFADYIPAAVATLKRTLAALEGESFPKLRALAEQL
jgi:NDP-sugar pyrophosphorylase family protein